MTTSNAIDKQFISEIDRLLNDFNATQSRSPAQQAEIDKYQKIHKQRDGLYQAEEDFEQILR